jgi:hypothetical protein
MPTFDFEVENPVSSLKWEFKVHPLIPNYRHKSTKYSLFVSIAEDCTSPIIFSGSSIHLSVLLSS